LIVVFNKKIALLGLGLGMLGLMAAAQIAGATHARPKGATPLRISLAVAYQACTSSNRVHAAGTPLQVPSCNPPAQQSSLLTVGTGDAWPGTTPKAVGFVRFDAKTTSPQDVLIGANITDVRCIGNSVSGACGVANTDNASVPDYTGQLTGAVTARITDHYSSPGFFPGTDPATVVDFPLTLPIGCSSTADTTVGSTCNVSSSVNTVYPGAITDGQRANIEAVSIVTVRDSAGQDFMRQGIWSP
jgi:hypothetical protein